MADYERNSGREIVGLIIILIGFGLLINTLNIFPMFPLFSIFHRFWLPAMFIGIGALILARRGPQDGLFPGMFFVMLGFLFLLSRMDLGFSFGRLIGPAILIWIGVAFLTRGGRPPSSAWRYRREEWKERHEDWKKWGEDWKERQKQWREEGYNRPFSSMEQFTDSSDFIHATAILGGFNRKCSSQQFRGGDLTAIMGGGKIDLREAKIQANEAVLDVFSLMGGIDIQLPPDWTVEPRFTPILGGFADRRTLDKRGTQKLVIHGTAIMGGITVSN
jgi:predicted membrane protein